jgi:hypothetical protein
MCGIEARYFTLLSFLDGFVTSSEKTGSENIMMLISWPLRLYRSISEDRVGIAQSV